MSKKSESIKERIEFLVELPLGTVWNENHWREALQLFQEFKELIEYLEDLELDRKFENG